MDLELNKAETEATLTRYHRRQDRVRQMQGSGATDTAVAISESYIDRVIDAVPRAIEETRRARGDLKGLVPLLLQMPAEKIALCALQTTLRSIGLRQEYNKTLRMLGGALEQEAFALKLTKHDAKMAKQVEEQSRGRRFRPGKKRGTVVEQRQRYARKAAAGVGFKVAEWSAKARTLAGSWLLRLVMETLPDVFVFAERGPDYKFVTITEGAEELAEVVVHGIIAHSPVFFPMREPPLPWTDLMCGGPSDKRQRNHSPVIRSRLKELRAKVKAAIEDGTMQPALDGLNVLQTVPWKINQRVLGVMRACISEDIEVEGLPGKKQGKPRVPKGVRFEDLNTTDQRAFTAKKREIELHNQTVAGERISLRMDMDTVKLLEDCGRFYMPMSFDFRGRVYPMCQFNFQREDRVRSLFLFADGEPLGEDGFYWLKIHVANCAGMKLGDGRKTDKLPFEERVAWVDGNFDLIERFTANPLKALGWIKADAPFLFLAACFELVSAVRVGPSYVCHLPVSFDGSCSGLQHLTAMTRAPEGELVNLTPNDVPADVYATVAECVASRVSADADRTDWPEGEEWKREVATLALAYGIDRKVCKRNVMTYSYSSGKHGMSGQQQEDLMDVLKTKVLEGKRETHPFAPYHNGRKKEPGRAARYLASHCFDGIKQVINLPAQAMAFLQKIAKTLADESKPVCWTTPVGLPWINRYNVPIIERVNLWMSDRGVRVRQRTNVTVGDEPEIAKVKSANAITPNLVHACDGSHLVLVARAAACEGIVGLATVHDSFGCLPSRARRFNEIIREQFVRMYVEHDVLAEILAQAKCDLTVTNHSRLPEVPHFGTLDLFNVHEAKYAFA